MIKNLIILLLISFSGFAFAQSEINISFKEKINLGKIDEDTDFYINSFYGKKHLVGNKINEYIFSKPAIYKITVEEKTHSNEQSCNHNHLPSEIIVNVNATKMTFDTASLSFSKPIQKNIDTKGIILSIAVNIETFDHLPAKLNQSRVNFAGIGSEINANLGESIKELPEGKHILTYNLNGIVTQNSYLMIDFILPNGTIQSVVMTEQIKD